MKKILFLVLATLLLVGCASGNTQISFNDELFSIKDTTVTTQNLYSIMKRGDGGSQIIKSAQNILVADVEMTDELQKEADTLWEEITSSSGEELTLQYYGFDSKEKFMDEIIYPEVKLIYLLKELMRENITEINEQYIPRTVRILSFDDETKANDAYQALKDGKPTEEVGKEYATAPYTGTETLYLKGIDTSMPTDVKTHIDQAIASGLSNIITVTANEVTTYYIVQVIDVDAARLEDQTIDTMINNETLRSDYFGKLFRKHNFRVYDESIYKALLENYSNYLQEIE